jgi:deoxyribonuclease-2
MLRFLLTAVGTLFVPTVLGCVDADGNQVDWWFQYKMPNSYKTTYTDSNSPKSAYLKISGALDDKENPPALIMTLRSLASGGGKNDEKIAWEPYFMYNDQPDNAKPSSSYGHTKGVVSTGSNPFWLLHSTPNFPSSDGKPTFYFPESEIIYGQTFLCVAISASEFDNVGTQLSYTHPYVYVNKVGDISKDYPKLASLLDGNFITSPGATNVQKFGKFTHMAKNSNWDDDMYENLVAKTLNSDLVVESWIRGGAEGTYCKPAHKYSVVDVETLSALDMDGTNITWRESQDHAKWALTQDSGHPYVCIADINRMKSQRTRAGGIFCFENSNLAEQLSGTIQTAHKCRGSRGGEKEENSGKRFRGHTKLLNFSSTLYLNTTIEH